MAEENEVIISLLKRIAEDVNAIKIYTRLQAKDAVVSLLTQIATTPERQQMWRLFDGNLSNEQISNKVGVTLRSVQYFVQEAESAGVVAVEKRGYPKRIVDVIPTQWKTWKPKQPQEPSQAGQATGGKDYAQ